MLTKVFGFILGAVLLSSGAAFAAGERGEFIYRGVVYAMKADFSSASAEFRQAYQLNRFDPEADFYLQIIEDIRQGLVPSSTAVNIFKGVDYFRKKYHNPALEELDFAIEASPGYIKAYLIRCNIFLDKADYRSAGADGEKMVGMDSSYAPGYNARGRVHLETGMYEKALRDFGSAIELDEDYSEAYDNRGNAYFRLGTFDSALADFNESLRIDPFYVQAYNDRGNVFLRLKQYAKAIADYSRAIELDPACVKAYNNRGVVFRRQEKYMDALNDFNMALKIDPGFFAAYFNKALVFDKLFKGREAAAAYSDFLARAGKDVQQEQNIAYAKRRLAFWRGQETGKDIVSE
ncbi:MAG: tetratricopeptide repeat protein [Elusimicrobia bacterium]|nr:tetratricopeptide repeat protein [Elusimicrobiota bacterium]